MPTTRPRLVALALPAGAAFVAALDRLATRGDAVLPVDPAAPRARTAALLEAVRPDALVTADAAERPLPDPLPTSPGTAVVLATSGSTGAPRAVTLPTRALAASWAAASARLGVQPGDRWLACLPPHHVAGLSVLWRSRLAGTAPVVLARFAVDAVARALDEVALVALVPTQLRRLLDAGVDLAGLRAVLLGGARADANLLARARATGVPVVTTYGMSETCGGCVYDGVPLDGVEVALAADGRIRLRGPMLLSGYRGRAGTTAALDADGWFTTADLGAFDPDRRLEVRGRVDDVIVTGGVNVLGTEVEAVLTALPEIADAAVVGVQDPEWGQRVVALVVVADTAAPPRPDGLRAAVRSQLGPAAVPKELRVVDDLPRLPTGKPDRLVVRTTFDRPARPRHPDAPLAD